MAEGNKTALGIAENFEALLCYVMGWVTGAVFLFIEKENRFVRFHAMQSLVTFLAIWIILLLLHGLMVILFVPFMLVLFYWLSRLVFLFHVFLWILLMVKAWQGEWYRLPVIGDFAARQLGTD